MVCWWVLHCGHYLLHTIHGPQTSTFLAQLQHLLHDSIRPWYWPSLWWWFQMEGWEGRRTHEAVARLRRVTRGSQSDFFLGVFGRLLCHCFLFDPALPSHQRRPVSPRILVPLTNIHGGALSFHSSTSNAINFTIVIALSHTSQLFTVTCVPQPVTAHKPLYRSIELMG